MKILMKHLKKEFFTLDEWNKFLRKLPMIFLYGMVIGLAVKLIAHIMGILSLYLF